MVILVHGTWGRRAPFAFADSDFCRQVRSFLGREVNFERFEWSGGNSHESRIAAGADLARMMSELRGQHPGSALYVIAHSHGGNLALYAARQAGRPFDGMCFLSTPFFQAVERDWRRLLLFGGHVLLAAVTLVAISVFVGSLILASSLMGLDDEIFAAVAGLFTFLGLPLLIAWVFFRKNEDFWGDPEARRSSLAAWFARFALRKAELTKQRLALPDTVKNALVISVKGDEALNFLLASLSILDAPYWLFALSWRGFFMGVVVTLAFGAFALCSGDPLSAWSEAFAAAGKITVVLAWLGFCLLPLTFVLGHWLKRTPVVLGESALFQGVFVRIESNRVPPFAHEHLMLDVSVRKQLNHSAVYSDGRTSQAVAQWLFRSEHGARPL